MNSTTPCLTLSLHLGTYLHSAICYRCAIPVCYFFTSTDSSHTTHPARSTLLSVIISHTVSSFPPAYAAGVV